MAGKEGNSFLSLHARKLRSFVKVLTQPLSSHDKIFYHDFFQLDREQGKVGS